MDTAAFFPCNMGVVGPTELQAQWVCGVAVLFSATCSMCGRNCKAEKMASAHATCNDTRMNMHNDIH